LTRQNGFLFEAEVAWSKYFEIHFSQIHKNRRLSFCFGWWFDFFGSTNKQTNKQTNMILPSHHHELRIEFFSKV